VAYLNSKTHIITNEEMNSGDLFLNSLEKQKVITTEDKAHVTAIHQETDDPIDLILCKLGLVTEKKLSQAFSLFFDIPLISKYSDRSIEDKSHQLNLNSLNQTWLRAHLTCFPKAGPFLVGTF